MTVEPRAVLDACVLVPMPLADTLLRLAETPRLYSPHWTQEIMDEVSRTLIRKWGMKPANAKRRELALKNHFPEAYVEGYQDRIAAMTNEEGDRHVLAAAVHCQADVIVTFNRRHFPPASVKIWKVDVVGPSSFLERLYDADPASVADRLAEQASMIDIPPGRLLTSLRKNVPGFVECFCAAEGIRLPSTAD